MLNIITKLDFCLLSNIYTNVHLRLQMFTYLIVTENLNSTVVRTYLPGRVDVKSIKNFRHEMGFIFN